MTAVPIKRKQEGLSKPAWAINIEMFGAQIGVFLDTNDFIHYVKNNFDIDVDSDDFVVASAEAGYVIGDDGVKYFYMLFHTDNPTVGLVAHEAVHAAIALYDTLGVNVDADNDEPLAYLVAYIVQCTVDEFKRLHKKGKLK